MRRTEWTDARLDDKMESIDSNADLLRTDIRELRTEMRGEFGSVRAEAAALRTEMRGEFGSVRAEAAALRTEMREEFATVRSDMNGEFDSVRTEMRDAIGALRRDFAALQTTLIQVGFGMVGVLLAAMIALIVAVA